jgi:hypothetical protein
MLKRSVLVLGFILGIISSATSFADERNIGSHEGLNLSLIQNSNDASELRVNLPKSVKPQILKLENPARLVIDLPGLSTNNNKTINLSENEPIKSVRLGRHPNNTRIVFDLKDASFPEYTLTNDGKIISLTFGKTISDAGATIASQASASSSATSSLAAMSPTAKNQLVAAKTETATGQANTAANSSVNSAATTAAAKNTTTSMATSSSAALAQKSEMLNAKSAPALAAKTAKSMEMNASSKKEAEIALNNAALKNAPLNNSQSAAASNLAPLSELSPAQMHAKEENSLAPKGRLDSRTLVESQSQIQAPSQAAALNNLNGSSRQVIGTPQVNKISFERDQSSQVMMIKISLSQRTPYTLSRTGQRAYRLALPETIFADENLTLPHFPPQDFKGITLVNPERGNGQVEFFIGVERDIKLASFAHDNEIWIKVDTSNE